MQNPYIPYPVVVDKIITEVDTKDIKTFRFKFVNPEDEAEIHIYSRSVRRTFHLRQGRIAYRYRFFSDAKRLCRIYRAESRSGYLGTP